MENYLNGMYRAAAVAVAPEHALTPYALKSTSHYSVLVCIDREKESELKRLNAIFYATIQFSRRLGSFVKFGLACVCARVSICISITNQQLGKNAKATAKKKEKKLQQVRN